MISDKRELALHYYKKIHSILQANICVFEVTYHSIGIGFLIQKAIDEQKPSIILYHHGHISFFISGVVDDNIKVFEYNNLNYKDILKEALDNAARKVRNKYLVAYNRKNVDIPITI